MKSIFLRAFGVFVVFSVICGVLYPAAMTWLSQAFFERQANGSLIEVQGKIYGSELLAQPFSNERYLWGRAMKIDVSSYKNATGEALLYAAPSNLSPSSKEYEAQVAARVAKIQAAHPEMSGVAIPVDLVTNSGSGLDPHISQAAALYQVKRIAKARNLSEAEVLSIIKACTQDKFLGIFGEKVVNVLKVNLMLDKILKP